MVGWCVLSSHPRQAPLHEVRLARPVVHCCTLVVYYATCTSAVPQNNDGDVRQETRELLGPGTSMARHVTEQHEVCKGDCSVKQLLRR